VPASTAARFRGLPCPELRAGTAGRRGGMVFPWLSVVFIGDAACCVPTALRFRGLPCFRSVASTAFRAVRDSAFPTTYGMALRIIGAYTTVNAPRRPFSVYEATYPALLRASKMADIFPPPPGAVMLWL
jgi:hypothetical protein